MMIIIIIIHSVKPVRIKSFKALRCSHSSPLLAQSQPHRAVPAVALAKRFRLFPFAGQTPHRGMLGFVFFPPNPFGSGTGRAVRRDARGAAGSAAERRRQRAVQPHGARCGAGRGLGGEMWGRWEAETRGGGGLRYGADGGLRHGAERKGRWDVVSWGPSGCPPELVPLFSQDTPTSLPSILVSFKSQLAPILAPVSPSRWELPLPSPIGPSEHLSSAHRILGVVGDTTVGSQALFSRPSCGSAGNTGGTLWCFELFLNP